MYFTSSPEYLSVDFNAFKESTTCIKDWPIEIICAVSEGGIVASILAKCGVYFSRRVHLLLMESSWKYSLGKRFTASWISLILSSCFLVACSLIYKPVDDSTNKTSKIKNKLVIKSE